MNSFFLISWQGNHFWHYAGTVTQLKHAKLKKKVAWSQHYGPLVKSKAYFGDSLWSVLVQNKLKGSNKDFIVNNLA